MQLTAPLVGLLFVCAAMVFVGCSSGGETTTQTSEALPTSDATTINEDVPVEALPDPLPAAYLFEDEVTIERLPITEITYIVQPGDTLASIAEQFCLGPEGSEAIQRLNNIVDINTIDVGEELRIPVLEGGCGAADPANNDPEEAEESQPPPGELHIVQEGETLAGIAERYGFTWIDLMNYNGLTEEQAVNLQIGQELIIPPSPEQSETQTDQQESGEPPG